MQSRRDELARVLQLQIGLREGERLAGAAAFLLFHGYRDFYFPVLMVK